MVAAAAQNVPRNRRSEGVSAPLGPYPMQGRLSLYQDGSSGPVGVPEFESFPDRDLRRPGIRRLDG